jgi:alkylation response protein AidB-like acyl-CoA dehydrogenase
MQEQSEQLRIGNGCSEGGSLDDLLTEISLRRGEFRDQRRLSRDIVEKLRTAGVFRTLVAREFGGDERPPADFLRLIERISYADGSTGWVASFGISALFLSSLAHETLSEIYSGGPDVIFAGAMHPAQAARSVPGGFEVSGRWKFASGSDGADIIGVGIRVENGTGAPQLRLAVLPSEKVTILPNWDVIGLQGTGSHDVLVDKVYVPDSWTIEMESSRRLAGPLFQYPILGFTGQVLAVVGLGLARAALDEIQATAGQRVSITGGPAVSERAYIQIELAKAEAGLRAARAYFYEATETVWSKLVAGAEPGADDILHVQLSSIHAARVAADVTAVAYKLSGTNGIYSASHIGQRVQDAMVVVQHVRLNESNWQDIGRRMLGMEAAAIFT